MPAPTETQPALVDLRVDAITPSPYNPRKHFDPERLTELAESIRNHGLLQSIVVRRVGDAYEIVAGERRWRAALSIGLETIPATVRQITDREAAELAVLENLQRESLTPLEEADGFAALVRHGWTQEQIAGRVGKSRAFVGNRLAISGAGDAVRDALEEDRISASVALVLARAPEAQRDEALNRLRERPSVEDALRVVKASSRLLSDAPFDVADASLCPASGVCGDCPRRSGAEASLFATDDDVCLDGECWRQKCGAAFSERAAAHPGRVLTAEEYSPLRDEWGGLRHDAKFVLRADEIEYFNDEPKGAKAKAAIEALPIVLAQDPDTLEPLDLIERAKVDAVRRKYFEGPGAKAAAAPKPDSQANEKQKAAEAERMRCEAAGEALVAAAIADRAGAAARLVALGTHDFRDDYSPAVLAVAGLKKQSSLCTWARKATKEELAAFLLAARLDGEYCAHADAVRALADQLDLPVPAGFEPPAPAKKAGKRGAK